jgi:hypothetical protein
MSCYSLETLFNLPKPIKALLESQGCVALHSLVAGDALLDQPSAVLDLIGFEMRAAQAN